MQRSGVVIAVCAGVAGLGGGYLLAQRSPAPAGGRPDELEIHVAAPHDPDAPNAIAALATSKSGGPVAPKPAASPLRSTTITFSLRLDDDPTKRRSDASACATAALVAAQGVLAGGQEPASPLVDQACGSATGATLSGRLRLAVRPTTLLTGQPTAGAFSCEATLRWQVSDPPVDLRAAASGDTSEAACKTAGEQAIATLATKI